MGEHPGNLIAIQYHRYDDHSTLFGEDRATFYGVTTIPDTWFDGAERFVGVTDVYAEYQTIYNNRIAIASDLTLKLAGEEVAAQTYDVSVLVTNDVGGSQHTVRIYAVQVLDNYPGSGDHELNCFIQAAPTQDITIDPGDSQVLTFQFTFTGDSWTNKENIKIIAWAQEIGSTPPLRVHNAQYMGWPFPDSLFDLGDMNCDGLINGFDIGPFIMVIGNSPPYTDYYTAYPDCDHMLADCNEDGNVNGFDIDPFIAILIGGG